MSTDIQDTPLRWGPEGIYRLEGSPDPGVYVWLRAPLVIGGSGKDILVWHWYQPAGAEPRWQCAQLGLHTVHSIEPLHVEASLGCDEGCPNHGWLRSGMWINV